MALEHYAGAAGLAAALGPGRGFGAKIPLAGRSAAQYVESDARTARRGGWNGDDGSRRRRGGTAGERRALPHAPAILPRTFLVGQADHLRPCATATSAWAGSARARSGGSPPGRSGSPGPTLLLIALSLCAGLAPALWTGMWVDRARHVEHGLLRAARPDGHRDRFHPPSAAAGAGSSTRAPTLGEGQARVVRFPGTSSPEAPSGRGTRLRPYDG